MRGLFAALALALLAGCASEARLSTVHQLGIHPARTANADGLQAMTDRHSGVRLWVTPQPVLTEMYDSIDSYEAVHYYIIVGRRDRMGCDGRI